jgi:adenylate cyclase
MVPDRLRLLVPALLIGLLTGGLLVGVRSLAVLQPLELTGYDLGLVLRQQSLGMPPVTLVEINERDIQAAGRWPLSDEQLVDALERIDAYRPRAIGLDIYRDVAVPPGTDRLTSYFDRTTTLTGIFKVRSDGTEGVAPPPALWERDRVGFSDMVLDDDGVVRRGLTFLDDGRNDYSSFSLKLALAYLAAEGLGLTANPEDPQSFRLGPTLFRPIPARYGGYQRVDDAGYQFLMDHLRNPADFPVFPLGDLLAGRIPADALADRVVLVGLRAESVKDSFVTPVSRWPWVADPQVAGIVVHGLLVDQLIRSSRGTARPMSAWGWGPETALIVVACLLGGLIGLLAGSATRLTLAVVLGVALITGTGVILFRLDFWLPVFPMALGWSVSAALVTAFLVQVARRERQDLERILSLQVSSMVADEIWRRREELLSEGMLKPQELSATVLFVDLQGFTRMTESSPPDVLLSWLNPFMALATEVILEHGGMVDDYFGDGVKANFGVPIRRSTDAEISDDARSAVECAVTLARRMARVDAVHGERHRLRFGIHTGSLVAATVGSRLRSKYTSVGDTVNVAARLETFAKEYCEREAIEDSVIVASDETVRRLGGDLNWRPCGEVELKGRVKPVTVHALVV